MSDKPRFGFVVQYVPDIEEATRFYADVLGLEIERYDPAFVQFEYFAIASDEAMGDNGGLELFWLVDDAEAAFSELAGKADVSLPLTQKPFGKVFGISDPSGQPRYLLALAQDRPSRPAR